MAVRVRYFAALRERKGRDQEQVEVVPGETLAALYARLFPEVAPYLRVAYARNHQTAQGEDVVVDGDEVAFLPPIGGG